MLQNLSIFTAISFFSPPTRPLEFKRWGEFLFLADGKNTFNNEGPNFWGQVGGWGAELGEGDEDLRPLPTTLQVSFSAFQPEGGGGEFCVHPHVLKIRRFPGYAVLLLKHSFLQTLCSLEWTRLGS